MTLDALVGPRPPSMKRFPGWGQGVLLPRDDRRAAALGVCMYTACRPGVLRAQRAAFHVVRFGGARFLPGRSEPVDLPGSPSEREELLSQWKSVLGDLGSVAVYRRRQRYRTGLTMIALDRFSQPAALLKLRDESLSLAREQEALTALSDAAPTTFRAPAPLGHGRVGEWSWSAQEVVFTRPHRPVLEAPRVLFEEISTVLANLGQVGSPSGAAPGARPSHGDVTPWNLRRDTHGQVWLFDWEDWGDAPDQSDRAYFAAASAAVAGTLMPDDLPEAALDHHRRIVELRHRRAAPGVTLPARLLAALDEATRLRESRR